MKVLVTGAAGLLGKKVCETLSKGNEVVAMTHQGMDITDRSAVLVSFAGIKPDAVVHCAAMTGVDACELDKEKAWSANVGGTANIVDACRNGIKLFFISTDYVFDGFIGGYKESDTPNPLNFYGKTKLAAEWLVSQLESHVIIRTSVIYGANKSNFMTWVIGSLQKGIEIKLFTDQLNSPAHNSDIAAFIEAALGKDANGIFHVASPEGANRYEIGMKICEIFGLDKNLIVPVTSLQLAQAAKRPMDATLSTEKAYDELGFNALNIEAGLKRLKQEMGI